MSTEGMQKTFMASRGENSGNKPAQDNTQHNSNGWSSMNGYPQTTMASCSHSEHTYMPPIASGPDPSQQTQQHKLQQQHPPLSMRHASHHHHQLPQLHMHSVPTHPTWPSMLTNPGGLAVSPPAIHYLPPHNGPNRLPLPPLKTKLRNKSGRTGPRKTLTDDDRRRMCEYAKANPGVKQSDIGSIFGVERSTVSKVLRNKEKFFVKARSPVSRKSKNKFPELERALSNWVRNAQRSGTFVTDAAIRDRFLFFVHSTGNSDAYQTCASGTWLEKFKQKNGINARQPLRRASETSSSDGYGATPPMSAMDSPSLIPMEPTGLESLLSPRSSLFEVSPLSRNRNEEEQEAEATNRSGTDRFMTFGAGHNNEDGTESMGQGRQLHHSESFESTMAMDACVNDPAPYKPGSSQGSTSVSSVFSATPVSSYSSSSVSPTGPYPVSPYSNESPFLACDPMAPPGSANFQRPRSQTLPTLNLEPVSQAQGQQQPARHDRCDSCYGGDSPIWSARLRRCASSNARCQTGPWSAGGSDGSASLNSGSGNGSGSGSGSGANGAMLSPCPPSQEDALQAADTLFRFIRSLPGVFNQADRADLSHIVDKVHLQSSMEGLETYGCEDGQRHT
ncbi:hypothetical protein SEPCBS57363_003423 [Sporothrix epigloea]|uniref:HTH CENPB-type domain-containing protein n=1 Tax=Sporothrix epigloea TaxID=1892477 RepID=A0ABP0DLD1_9PEZI